MPAKLKCAAPIFRNLKACVMLREPSHVKERGRWQCAIRVGRERREMVAGHVRVLVSAEPVLHPAQSLQQLIRGLSIKAHARLERVAQLLRPAADLVVIVHDRIGP